MIKNILLATAFGCVLSSMSYAQSCDLQSDRCSSSPPTSAEVNKSIFLADSINARLEELAEKQKQNGTGDLKVVIVGRMGNKLDKFKVMDDENGQLDLKKLIMKLKAQSQDFRNQQENTIPGDDRIVYEVMQKNIDKKQTLKYSHLGIAFRNFELKNPEGGVETGTGTGKWAMYHLLYSCEDQKISHIFKGTMYDFFMDHLSDYGAELIVPTQEVQNNLEDILLKKRRVYRYQTNQYNAVAKIDDLTQQNSNQFVLEALAAAMRPDGEIMSRQQAVDLLNKTGYTASKLAPSGLFTFMNIGVVQKLISSIMPTVCLKNQPELKSVGIGEVVTANSVVNWMQRNNLVQQVIELSLSKDEKKTIDAASAAQQKTEKN